MKQLILTALLLITSLNSFALSKQDKVDIINEKANEVFNCMTLFMLKGIYHEKHNSEKFRKAYFDKSKKAESLYVYLLYGVGNNHKDVNEQYSKIEANIKKKIESSASYKDKLYKKMVNPRITPEEKQCNLILKYPRTALNLSKVTKKFYEKDYMNFNPSKMTNCKQDCKSYTSQTLWNKQITSTQNKSADSKNKKNKRSYLQNKAKIPLACIYYYKNSYAIDKKQDKPKLASQSREKYKQALRLHLYLMEKGGQSKKRTNSLYIQQIKKDTATKESWSKALYPQLEYIKSVSFTGKKTYQQICDYTLKFPSTALNLNGVIKKFYESDY